MMEPDFSAGEHESISNAEIDRAAHLWFERHGADAVAAARTRVAELRRNGDLAGADVWLRLIVAVEEKTQGRRR